MIIAPANIYGAYGSTACSGVSNSASSSSSSSVTKPPAEIEGYLADASYKVRSFDLRHVTQPLELLETVMVISPNDLS
ncbi:hypothetical protein CerSpe_113030 [Prunus speciosa]